MNERAHDLPLCPEGDFRFWGGVGVIALLALVIGCLAGLPALLPIETISPTAIQRLSAAGASVVWLLLCTGAGAAAFAAIALVRGRPPGSAIDIISRAFACVAVAALTNFVPIDQPMLKLAFDGLALPPQQRSWLAQHFELPRSTPLLQQRSGRVLSARSQLLRS